MGSPTIFAGKRTKLLTQEGLLTNAGRTIDYDGTVNYIANGTAEVNTLGWSTYALTESVTFQDTGDTVTLTSHGLTDGQRVAFTVITSTTGISTNTFYYVVNAATDTFQLSDTIGGAAKALTTNGSGTMVRELPVNGSGGTANITWTRSTSSPLRGNGSYLLSKGAANYCGEGVAYDFTIAAADLANVLQISFEYNIASGTYADDEVEVFIYDVTNAKLILPVSQYVKNVGINSKFYAVFQSDVSSTSYRLLIHCGSVGSTAFDLKIDDVQVGPLDAAINQGAFVCKLSRSTNQTGLAPNNSAVKITFTTTDIDTGSMADLSNNQIKITKPGNYLIVGRFALASTNVVNNFYSLRIYKNNTTSINGTGVYIPATTTFTAVGCTIDDAQVGDYYDLRLFGSGNNSVNTLTAAACELSVTSLDNYGSQGIEASQPCVAMYKLNSSSANTSFADAVLEIVDYNEKVIDTLGCVTTGASWSFTAKSAGNYFVTATNHWTNTTNLSGAYMNIYKNGALFAWLDRNVELMMSGSVMVPMNAGDTLDIRLLQDDSASAARTISTTDSGRNHITIIKDATSQILGGDVNISCKYTSSTTTIGTTATTVIMPTKVWDTHSIYNTTTGLATIPVTGEWEIIANLSGNGASTTTANDALTLNPIVNGTTGGAIGLFRFAVTGVTLGPYTNGSCRLRLNAGDTVGVTGVRSANVTSFALSGSTANAFQLSYIGL